VAVPGTAQEYFAAILAKVKGKQLVLKLRRLGG